MVMAIGLVSTLPIICWAFFEAKNVELACAAAVLLYCCTSTPKGIKRNHHRIHQVSKPWCALLWHQQNRLNNATVNGERRAFRGETKAPMACRPGLPCRVKMLRWPSVPRRARQVKSKREKRRRNSNSNSNSTRGNILEAKNIRTHLAREAKATPNGKIPWGCKQKSDCFPLQASVSPTICPEKYRQNLLHHDVGGEANVTSRPSSRLGRLCQLVAMTKKYQQSKAVHGQFPLETNRGGQQRFFNKLLRVGFRDTVHVFVAPSIVPYVAPLPCETAVRPNYLHGRHRSLSLGCQPPSYDGAGAGRP